MGLFDNLKRLFSSDVVIRNVGGDELRVIDTDRIQSLGTLQTNALVDRFTKIYTTSGAGIYNVNNVYNYQTLRVQLYTDYESMDTDAIVASALDIIADECTLKNEHGEMLHVRSSDENIQRILYNLFYDVLNIEFNLWSWARNMCKYGDFYLKLEIAEKFGVYNVIPFSAYSIIREEGTNPKNPTYIRFKYDPTSVSGITTPQTQYALGTSTSDIYFENYEMAHFRLISDVNYLPYGRCLHPNSRITTENSIKEIKDIIKGDKVWTFNIEENKYELADVLATVNSGIKKIYSVKTVHNEIKGSDNHPILVWDFDEEKPNYKQIKDLKKGDYLCSYKQADIKLSNPKLNKDIFELGPHDWKCDLSCLESFPEIVTPEFARFWGFMLGDGWQNGNVFGFARGINNERNEYYENLLKKYSGKSKLSKIYSKTSKVKNSGVTVASKLFHHFMTINGYVGKSYSKRLPNWIYECDEETQLSLVKGLMDADGYVFTDKWNCNSYNLTLNNKELLQDLKSLLDRAKIKTGIIRPRKFTGKCNFNSKEYNARQSYDFTFYLDGKRKQQYTKYNLINSKYNVELFKIKSITEELPEETYDIQVSKNSNFISDGIIVHNSYLEPGRKIFKQMILMEDAMLIHRIVRAPEKRVFYMNVGAIPPNEVEAYMQKTVQKLKKVPFVDPQTGQYNLKYNIMNMMEDFYIPVRSNDQSTRIDTAKGLEYNGIEDVAYLRDKLFAALKIPKAFMGYEKDLTGKATLAAEDIRFARTVERIQRILLSELTKIALVHLYSQGYDGESLTNFDLSLTTPSIIYDQERVALMKEKVDLAAQIMENNLLPTDWIYDNLFHFSEDQYDEYRDLLIQDKARKFRLSQIEEEGNDPAETGQVYGTPHQLATAYGKGRGDSKVPTGYNEKDPNEPVHLVGRPKTSVSNINRQDNPFGKDRIGAKTYRTAGQDQEDTLSKTQWKGGSPLAMETYLKNKGMFDGIPVNRKTNLFEQSNLLDENNIRDEIK